MKKVLFFMAMALTCAFATAQTNQVVWLNGKVLYGHPITAIDSLTYDMDGMMEGDTLHLIMPRSTVYVVHDTVIKTNTVYVKDTVYINKCGSEGQGVFSVSADKQVSFAKGNLQYQASTKTWRFAENQYDYIGSDNSNISDTYSGWIDLFGWSGSTGSAKWGISTSTDYNDYSGDFVDWSTNTIGTDAPDTWRTLTIDEWQYLFMHTRWTMAKVNGTLGFMLLPADFVASAGLTISILGDGNMSDAYKNFSESDYSANVYTASQFSQLESAGVVFLPCAGFHRGSSVGNVGSVGYYWSATPGDTDRAGYVYFGSWNAFANGWYDCSLGQSVRLVKNYSNVSTDATSPSTTDTTPARKVLRNGQVLIERNGKTYTLTGVEVK